MTAPRSPEQRARFVRSTASDLDVAPELAEQLLLLSESARAHAREPDRTDSRTARALLDCLLDEDTCAHAWWVAGVEGEALWRFLLRVAIPPRDVGPAVLLAVALAPRGAAADALEVVTGVLRPGEFRRSAIEVAAELSEDAGRPELAWGYVRRLGLADPDADWGALRCALGCSERGRCERSLLAGVAHARWLRRRLARWARRPWSGGGVVCRGPFERYGERLADAVAGYLTARAALLPAGERQLLARWAQVGPEQVTVVEGRRWEVVVAGEDGVQRTAGLESPDRSEALTGTELRCHLLPTLVPAEHLLVRSSLPPRW